MYIMPQLEKEQEAEDLKGILRERAKKEGQAPLVEPEGSVTPTGIREFIPRSPAVADLAV